ncbi:hypothetical protein C8J56DRAFT_17396 [Mycena floridula]|nr:hypothetical protein C8J56DRAFT_17396 [Mycena floridula]
MSSFESAPSRTSSEDRYDQDDRDSSSSYTDNGTPRASKVQKVTSGSAVDTPKKNLNRPRLPGAGPWHVDYALQPGGNAQRNKRKDLNISPDYGDEDFWPPSAGFRELVQNDYDACLAALQARPGLSTCTSNDIERRVETTFNDRSGQPSYLDISRLRVNEIVTFTFYYKKQYDEPLGWISVKGLGWGECDIEMYNGGGPLVLEQCMTLGYSSKTGKSEFIGQHGDGMKMVRFRH